MKNNNQNKNFGYYFFSGYFMTFSQQIKEEICRNEYTIDEKKAILSSFLKNIVAINISNNKVDWEIKSKAPLTIRFIANILKELYSIEKELFISEKKSSKFSRSYKLEFYGDFNFIEKDLLIFEDSWKILKKDNLKYAFLTGLFLCGGSINSPISSNYHFELSIHNYDLLKTTEKIFKYYNIKYSSIQRKNKYVIYIKKSETISDLLKMMGASNSMFQYEEKRIYRDYSNQMSRLNNLDISNIKKIALASHEQIKHIEFIKKNNLFYKLSEKEKIFCELRLENKEASLNDLVFLFKQKHNIEISKAGINHFVRKIKKIYIEKE